MLSKVVQAAARTHVSAYRRNTTEHNGSRRPYMTPGLDTYNEHTTKTGYVRTPR